MINLHDPIIFDGLFVIFTTIVGYFFKFSVKPNKAEVKFVAQALALLLTLLVKWANKHMESGHYFEKAKDEMRALKDKLSNKYIVG